MSKELNFLHKNLGVFVMFILKPNKMVIKFFIYEKDKNEWCYKEAH